MGHILDYDGKFINFLNKATDTLIATLLWLVCSIPIITIGASTTAFYSVMLKLVKDEESYITKSFFKSPSSFLLANSRIILIDSSLASPMKPHVLMTAISPCGVSVS